LAGLFFPTRRNRDRHLCQSFQKIHIGSSKPEGGVIIGDFLSWSAPCLWAFRRLMGRFPARGRGTGEVFETTTTSAGQFCRAKTEELVLVKLHGASL